MKVGIIGTGYVGLVTGVCLADYGHDVTCIDCDSEKIDILRNFLEPPIYEEGLSVLLKNNKDRIWFTDSMTECLKNYLDIIFICVPTPQNENGEHNMEYVIQASKDIANNVKNECIVVVKSTVPVNTCRTVKAILDESDNKKFHIASNPEFLREGKAITDFKYPDRIIIGIEKGDTFTSDKMKMLYSTHCRDKHIKNPIINIVDIRSAEIIKHGSNSFLAMKISYANLLSDLCYTFGVDTDEVLKGIGLDRRIQSDFLRPGLGFGGSCFPKDLNAFISLGKEMGHNFTLFEEVKRINEFRISRAIHCIRTFIDIDDIPSKKVLILGKTFKPNTDDIRESQAVKLGNLLQTYSCEVTYYDTILYPNQLFLQEAEDKDCIAIAVEDPKFKELEWDKLSKKYKKSLPMIFDFRNLFPLEKVKWLKSLGYKYFKM